jgi:hypothetical protein
MNVKLPVRERFPGHAVASRMRAKELFIYIVPLDPVSETVLRGPELAKRVSKYLEESKQTKRTVNYGHSTIG